jgi:hypothetical protein
MLVPALASDPAYMTPLATVTNEVSKSPCGSGVCHKILPVAGSRAAQEPRFSGQCRATAGERIPDGEYHRNQVTAAHRDGH